MEISKLFVQARSATVQIADGGLYHTKAVYQLFLNGQAAGTADTAVTSLYDLQPETEYVLSVRWGAEEVGQCAFRTARESYTLNVRQFGAVGDGVHDDTAAIQAAILHCPADGRVLIPAGRYHVLPLMLKSHVRIELRRGATLLLETDRSKIPILPGMILSTDETDDLNLGSWEGNPLDMYAAFISGMDVEDVVLYGEGVLDGQGNKSDWWQNCKVRRGAWRPRMLFLNHCKNVTVQGVIDDIVFENVRMEHVGTPYVVNCMYFCDPDGKSEYVQSREKQPVDERTPRIGTVAFRHVTATDVTCAGYFLGLPERPIEAVVMEDVHISCDKNAKPMQPAMAQGVPYLARKGLTAINVAKIVLKDVTIIGQDGAKLECDGVGEVEK